MVHELIVIWSETRFQGCWTTPPKKKESVELSGCFMSKESKGSGSWIVLSYLFEYFRPCTMPRSILEISKLDPCGTQNTTKSRNNRFPPVDIPWFPWWGYQVTPLIIHPCMGSARGKAPAILNSPVMMLPATPWSVSYINLWRQDETGMCLGWIASIFLWNDQPETKITEPLIPPGCVTS